MPRESYDVIVVGDELPGLVAATLCARRGMRVLLGQIAPRSAAYALGGIKLPVEPLLLGGVAGPAIRRVFDELHFQHLIKRKLRSSAPAFQVVGPDLRLDIDGDDAALGRELTRELGEGHPALRQLTRASALAAGVDRIVEAGLPLPSGGFWERRELSRVAGDLGSDAQAWGAGHGDDVGRAIAELPGAFLTSCAIDRSPLAAARSLDLLRQGAPRLVGDLEALREIFLDKLRSHSGEVKTVEVTGLTTSWGKVTGVVLGGEEVGAGHLIAALPTDQLAPLLDGKAARRIAELGEQAELCGYRYTLNLVVDALGVPEGMGSTVLCVAEPGAPMHGGNAFALHASPPDDHARTVVTVQALCAPPPHGVPLEDALAELRAAVRRNLDLVMPFADGHVQLAHSPNQEAPAEGVDVDLAVVAPARPLWRAVSGGTLGLSALDYATGIKNFTLASSQVLPGLGIEGEFLTGWSAARIACEAGGKKRDYLQGEVISSQ